MAPGFEQFVQEAVEGYNLLRHGRLLTEGVQATSLY
jgi:hypothetical protein